jgi:putative endonuclease
MGLYYVYLLECCDGSFYTGVTNDLSRRIIEHKQGLNIRCYTYNRRPVTLKHYLTFKYINDAISIEKKLKKWSRAKKVAYFNKDLKILHEKAKCRNTSSHKFRSSEDEAF